MKKMNLRGIGLKFETRAREYLESQGFQVLETNARARFGELDIVAEEQLAIGHVEIVFVEVRARQSDLMGGAMGSVDHFKQQKIIRLAHFYLSRYRGPASSVRFDVIAFEGEKLVHLRNAF